MTGLTAQTISNIIDKLVERGVMRTIGRRSGQRGQPAIEVGLNPEGGYGIGVHLDREHWTVAVLDLSGRCLQIASFDWDMPDPVRALPLIEAGIAQIVAQAGLDMQQVWGVGVALPGPLDMSTGSVMNPPWLVTWDGFPLRDWLNERLGVPVYLETDATAAAQGECWFGHGRGIDDFFYIYFGIGLGGGMVVHGRPYRGGLGNAAMFGHISVDPGGPRCPCGGRGCLELYVSISSLMRALSVKSPADLSEINDLLSLQDPALLHWLNVAADKLTTGLVTLEHLISPTAIIFGGQMDPVLRRHLASTVAQLLPERRMQALKRHPTLIQSSILESAAAVGAATLPLFGQFSQAAQYEAAI